MLIGAADVVGTHAAVIVGAPELSLLPVADPVAADGTHVVVKTRGQVAATRVSLWSRAMPAAGQSVFDGELDLVDGVICVTDADGWCRFTKKVAPGRTRVVVRVDDPGYASRVYVGVGLGTVLGSLGTVPGLPLPDVIVASAERLDPVDELGLILDEHSSAMARLAAAVVLVSRQDVGEERYPGRFEIAMIAEWLRGLSVYLTNELARGLADSIAAGLRAERDGAAGRTFESVADDVAITLASNILRQIDSVR